MMRRDIWGECADGLWVCLRVRRPVGKGVHGHLGQSVVSTVGLDGIGCPLTSTPPSRE